MVPNARCMHLRRFVPPRGRVIGDQRPDAALIVRLQRSIALASPGYGAGTTQKQWPEGASAR
jgi:hypothetical protein